MRLWRSIVCVLKARQERTLTGRGGHNAGYRHLNVTLPTRLIRTSPGNSSRGFFTQALIMPVMDTGKQGRPSPPAQSVSAKARHDEAPISVLELSHSRDPAPIVHYIRLQVGPAGSSWKLSGYHVPRPFQSTSAGARMANGSRTCRIAYKKRKPTILATESPQTRSVPNQIVSLHD